MESTGTKRATSKEGRDPRPEASNEQTVVSGVDEIRASRTEGDTPPRRLSEFDPANAPLSAEEIRRQRAYLEEEGRQGEEWARRSSTAGMETTPATADTHITAELNMGEQPLTGFNETQPSGHDDWTDLDDDNRRKVKR